MGALTLAVALAGLTSLAGAGCVSKGKADQRARAAFVAGQQQALERMRQAQGPSVTIMGPVATPILPWTADLTLTKALVQANYLPSSQPKEILIIRQGRAFTVEPEKLLSGEDVPLEQGDVVKLVAE